MGSLGGIVPADRSLEPPVHIRHTAQAMSTDPTPSHAAVIGLGRFGRFWAELLSDTYQVVGTSRRTVHGLPSSVRQVPLEEAVQAEVIFLTVAISAMPEVVRRIAPMVRRDATVVDTCSVKLFPVEQMTAHLPASVDIVACHPMFGPDSARERVDALPTIMWPIRDRYGRYGEIMRAFTDLNFRVVEMKPDDHDREAAFTQGVTHLVGRLLKGMELKPSTIATLGYTRLLQVMEQTCNDPLELFHDLQTFNPYTPQMRRRFSAALEGTEALLSEPWDGSRTDSPAVNLDHRGSHR